jgi:peroxiredoxin
MPLSHNFPSIEFSRPRVAKYQGTGEDALKQLGLTSNRFRVNDGAVMNAWAADQTFPEDSMVKLMGDPTSLTEKS